MKILLSLIVLLLAVCTYFYTTRIVFKFADLEIQSNLNQPVKITYDSMGVPTISAPSIESSFFGQGCVHVLHRQWQMDKLRKMSQGKLSEYLGEKTLGIDQYIRTIGIHKAGVFGYEGMKDEQQIKYVTAYISGVNKCAQKQLFSSLEYYILWISMEPWTEMDVFSVMALMNHSIVHDTKSEMARENLDAFLDPDLTDLLVPVHEEYDGGDDTIISEEELKMQGNYAPNWEKEVLQEIKEGKRSGERIQNLIYKNEAKKVQGPIPKDLYDESARSKTELPIPPGEFKLLQELAQQITGSNAFVIHGNHTKSGKPILANDPHLGNEIPCLWFFQRFIHNGAASKREYQYVFGATIPGLMGLFSGRNDKIAFGITALFTDTSDTYEEKIFEDGTYLYDGKREPLREVKERFKVKGTTEPVQYSIYYTHHGALMRNAQPYLSFMESQNKDMLIKPNYANAWSSVYKSNGAWIKSVIAGFQSRSRLDFNKFADTCLGASINFIMASVDGDIGFAGCGDYPIRRPEITVDFSSSQVGKTVMRHQRVQDGSTSQSDWIGFIQGKEVPRSVNPKRGFIVTANSKLSSQATRYGIGSTVIVTPRQTRITEEIEAVIAKGEKFQVNDAFKIQQSEYDYIAEDVRKAWSYLKKKYDPKGANIIEQPFTFGHTSEEGKRLAFYYIFEKQILSHFFVSQNDPQDVQSRHSKILRSALNTVQSQNSLQNFLNINNQNDKFSLQKHHYYQQICDSKSKGKINISLAKGEQACFEVLDKLYKQARTLYVKEYEMKQWSQIHKHSYKSLPLSMTPLSYFVDREQPTRGSRRTIDSNGHNYNEDTFESKIAPNIRMVTDLGDVDDQSIESGYSMDTGQSDNPFSKYYDNFLKIHGNPDPYSQKLVPQPKGRK